jgi:hypothetical protein
MVGLSNGSAAEWLPKGSVEDLGGLVGNVSLAFGINNLGDAVGGAQLR